MHSPHQTGPFHVLSRIWLIATSWPIDRWAPLSMGFPRQEYWSGLPFPVQGDLPNPGIAPMSLASPTLAGGFFTTSAIWGTSKNIHISTLHPRACMYAQTLCTIHFMLHLFVYNNQADFGKLKKIWNWTILTCSYHNTAHSNWNSKGDPSLKRRNVGLLF